MPLRRQRNRYLVHVHCGAASWAAPREAVEIVAAALADPLSALLLGPGLEADLAQPRHHLGNVLVVREPGVIQEAPRLLAGEILALQAVANASLASATLYLAVRAADAQLARVAAAAGSDRAGLVLDAAARRRGLKSPAAAAVEATVTQRQIETHRLLCPTLPVRLLRGAVFVLVGVVAVVALVVFDAGLIVKRSERTETLPPPEGTAVTRRR